METSTNNSTQDFNFNDYKANNKKVTWITRKLWWCAGADEYFLERSPKQDQVKYAGIGAIVLATGLLAALAGGVAFNTMFGPREFPGELIKEQAWWEKYFLIFTILFSVVWGLIIFNLDRFIVSSTGKGDGTDTITWKEVKQALPRIIIALILGFSISKPLELLMLKSEIDVELNIELEKKREEFDKLSYAKFDKQINDLNLRLKKIDDQRNILIQDLKLSEAKYIDQMEGKSGGGFGEGKVALKLKIIADEKKKAIENFEIKNKKEITTLKSQIEIKHNDRERELTVTNIDKVKDLGGLLARLDISHKIGFWIGIFITAILLCIEMGPIFFKMMMTKGPYDYMVENYNYTLQAENGLFKEDKMYEGRNGMIHMESFRYIDAELAIHNQECKLQKQKEVDKSLIDLSAERKLKDIKENPDKYIG